MATPTHNNSISLRRKTQPYGASTSISSSSFVPHQRPMMAPKNHAQCTHLTMTRLYTPDFRCGVCFRPPTTGWIYRCTQDRELLIQDDVARGEVDKIDALGDLFPSSSITRKSSAVARASPLSFLDEVSDQALKGYTSAQLSMILKQRAQVLEISKAASEPIPDNDKYNYNYTNPSGSSPLLSHTQSTSKVPLKPWLPPKGAECQFKCCHFCRPTLTERAFLSLNGIVNNDIPATAIYGFGFHLHARKRPVALVKHVKILGLRTSPPVRQEDTIIGPDQSRVFYLSNQLAAHRQEQDLGLGLVALHPSLSARPLPPIPTVLPTSSPLTQLQTHFQSLPLQNPATTTVQVSPVVVNTAPTPYLSPYSSPARSILLRRLDNADSNVAILTPLPDHSDEEVQAITQATPQDGAMPLTPMESSEMGTTFGVQPLEISGGVAVTEEAVVGHFADVITQV